jgi:hypothetical protein
MPKCPVCSTELISSEDRGETVYFECRQCGTYTMGAYGLAFLNSKRSHYRNASAKISHSIRKRWRHGVWVPISHEFLVSVLENTELPSPLEQMDNLIAWIGNAQEHAGTTVPDSPAVIAAVGAVDHAGLEYIVEQAIARDLIKSGFKQFAGQRENSILPMQLTMRGWEEFELLRRGKISSRIAFMAMPFNDSSLDAVYRDHFQPAVKSTGFTLKRLDESQPAGLIDDRLRIEIRQSKFIIAELTHSNSGAYWEAGYAEGLGKPVIYACSKEIFDDAAKKPHFDTNHHLIVVWDPSNPASAMQKLKDTIRATLPDEAVLND